VVGKIPPTFLCSNGKVFRWDRSRKFKNTRRKGTEEERDRLNKKQEGRIEGNKKRFLNRGGSNTGVFFIYWEHPSPLCDPPSGEPTHTGISLTKQTYTGNMKTYQLKKKEVNSIKLQA